MKASTVKAELELARIKRPRIITPQKANDLIATLRPYSATKKYWIIVDKGEKDIGSEQETLSERLREIFGQAHWKEDAHTMKDRTKTDPPNLPNLDSGCLVSTEFPDFAIFIADSLRAAGVDCMVSLPNPEMASDSVVIEIGL